jgi:hypothetical protein
LYDSILAVLPQERRKKNRYPVHLDLTWGLMLKGNVLRGSGRTSNMSSNGVLFKHSEMPQEVLGRNVELKIQWPVPLEDFIPLQLMAHGKIVRLDSMGCAVKLTHAEFRTCKAQRNANVLEALA